MSQPTQADNQAADALFQAQQQDQTEQATSQPAQGQTDQSEPFAIRGDEQPESFTNLDPNILPEEARPFYKSMQADYTRKTQAIAEKQKIAEQVEQLGGLDAVMYAVDHAARLNSDPNYAAALYESLGQSLQGAGVLQPDEGQDETAFGYDESDVPSELDQRLSQLESYIQTQDQQQYETQLANQVWASLNAAETEIRQQNPQWKQEDIDRVYNLAHAYDGNLKAAAQEYAQWNQNAALSYMNQKAQIPLGTSGSGSAGSGTQPPRIDNLEMAEKIALERLRNELA